MFVRMVLVESIPDHPSVDGQLAATCAATMSVRPAVGGIRLKAGQRVNGRPAPWEAAEPPR